MTTVDLGDLDDLERIAQVAIAEDPEWYGDEPDLGWSIDYESQFPLAKEHIEANGPRITLALIERIRTAERERDEAIAKLPNWSHAEALQQRDALLAANVAAQQELRSLRALLAAARKLAPNWRDTSGSASSVDAINEGCEAVVRAVEAIDMQAKEGT